MLINVEYTPNLVETKVFVLLRLGIPVCGITHFNGYLNNRFGDACLSLDLDMYESIPHVMLK